MATFPDDPIQPETGVNQEDGGVVKNPAAVALGRLGGLKGGNARSRKLSRERRREIAAVGAAARWKNHSKTQNHGKKTTD